MTEILDAALRGILKEAIEQSGFTREHIAERMAAEVGALITVHSLNTWTALSRRLHRFPLFYLPAFERIVKNHIVSTWLIEQTGGKVLYEDALLEEALKEKESQRNLLDAEITALRASLKRAKK